MGSASPVSTATGTGAGEVSAAAAAAVTDPVNPNAGLRKFLVADPRGGSTPVMDTASWRSAAQSDASWSSASWTSASWTSASWSSASWTSASWTSASWTSASWTSTSQSDASWVSNAQDDINSTGGYYATPAEIQQAELDLSVDLNGDGIIGPPPLVTTSVIHSLP
jgi:hypothetical protein